MTLTVTLTRPLFLIGRLFIFGPYTEDDVKPYLENDQWILRDNLCDFLEILPCEFLEYKDVANKFGKFLPFRIYGPEHDKYTGKDGKEFSLLQCWEVLD